MPKRTKFSDKLFAEVLKRIAAGESLRAISKDKDMPSGEAVRCWVRDDDNLAAQYALAREAQAELYAEEIVEIADDCDDPQKARVQIDARKWFASKVAPKKYGDKIAHEHGVNENLVNMMKTLEGGRGRARKRAKPES